MTRYQYGDFVVVQNHRYPNGELAIVLNDFAETANIRVWRQGALAYEDVARLDLQPTLNHDRDILMWLFSANNFQKVYEFSKNYPINATNFQQALDFIKNSVTDSSPVIEARIIR